MQASWRLDAANDRKDSHLTCMDFRGQKNVTYMYFGRWLAVEDPWDAEARGRSRILVRGPSRF